MSFNCQNEITNLHQELLLPKKLQMPDLKEKKGYQYKEKKDYQLTESQVREKRRFIKNEKELERKTYCNLLNLYLSHKSGLSKDGPEINLKTQKLNQQLDNNDHQ